MKILLRLLVGAAALLLIARFLPQALTVTGWYPAIIAALFIGISNVTIRPLLLLLSIPLTLITFGLFTLVIDAALLLFISSVVEGFQVVGFWWAIVLAFLLTVVKYVGNKLINAFFD